MLHVACVYFVQAVLTPLLDAGSLLPSFLIKPLGMSQASAGSFTAMLPLAAVSAVLCASSAARRAARGAEELHREVQRTARRSATRMKLGSTIHVCDYCGQKGARAQ